MNSVESQLTEIREDVAYIKAKIEALPDHETRIRVLERFRYAVPSISVLGLLVAAITAVISFH